MALPVTIPNQFANATSSIPLSQLDTNFNTLSNAVNGINSGAETLANLVATTANVTTGNITTVNATTVDTTNIEVTNIKAKDGTASATIADSTGVMTIASSVLTTTDINGGTLDNVVIGGATANAATFTSITDSGNLTFTGTGNRITGDFSNATIANRVFFQNSVTNAASDVAVIPNGTSNTANFTAFSSSSNQANTTLMRIGVDGSTTYINSFRTGTGTYLPMTFNTGGSEGMRIDTSGNVGIGTTTPTGRFEISSDANSAQQSYVRNINAGSSAFSGVNVGNDSSATAFRMLVGSSTATAFGGADSANLVNSRNSPMTFWTNNTERARIDSNGNLLIGYTSSNGSYKLQVNSQIFATNATIATSDGRYKENIQTLDGALSLVSQLNPVQFSWKEHPVHNFDRSGPTIGFIAQEVEQVLVDKPYLNSIIKRNECVIEPEEKDAEGNITKEAVTEEFLGIAEGNMIALLTKALQELKADFDAYKASHP